MTPEEFERREIRNLATLDITARLAVFAYCKAVPPRG